MTMNLTARNHFYQYQNPIHQLKPFDIEAVPIIAHRILQLAGQTYKFHAFEIMIIDIHVKQLMRD